MGKVNLTYLKLQQMRRNKLSSAKDRTIIEINAQLFIIRGVLLVLLTANIV